ncbi:Mpo1 family 2-hydroxy fatty acid dioxygenase [Lysobacter fragariae]
MSASEPASHSPERPIDRWFASYSSDHRNPTNQLIHVVCVPAILWSVVALLWCLPSPGTWFRQGLWAALSMFAAWMFYYRASRPLGLGMLAQFVLMAFLTRWLHDRLGTTQLFQLAIAVFVVAWIGQFVGHKIEGRKPSFLTDLTYLLIGPAWVVAKLYRKMGWQY